MDVIYTDPNRIDQGVLQDFSIDFDTTDTMDYVLTLSIKKNILTGGCWWYIQDTEYAGIVDSMEVNTEDKTIKYSGRNARGFLTGKIICPAAGQDYKIVSGSLCDIAQKLIQEAGIQDLYTIAPNNIQVTSFQFGRYVNLYEGLTDLAYSCGKVVSLRCQTKQNGKECRLGRILISFADRLDYSKDIEFTSGNINFRIKKGLKTVNHLICMGQGELKNRMVAHLYVDADGDIVEKQCYHNLEEYTEVYENTSAATMEELKQGGADRLGELLNTDEMEVTADDINLKIGDVVGGYEPVTASSIRREIVNIIMKADRAGMSLEYKVGGTDPGAASLPSEIVEEYTLPMASDTVLGGIRSGEVVYTEKDGTIKSKKLEEFTIVLQEAVDICR